MDKQAPEAAVQQLLSFQLGGLQCALELAHVREIVRYEPVTRVPRVASCVRGVVNLRGSVLPVIDLAVGFGMPPAPVTAQTCLLVVEAAIGGDRAAVGLVADSVSQVLELRADEVEPTPSFGTPIPAAFLLGLARSEGTATFVLDIVRMVGPGGLLGGGAAGEPVPLAPPAFAGESA